MLSPSPASGTLCLKVKKASGEIVYCGQVFEKFPLWVKNFSIWLRYDSRSGTHNMFGAYRDLMTRVPSPSATETWAPRTVPRAAGSRS